MTARTLADLVLAFHFVFIVFTVLGGFLVFWKSWVACLHVPSVLWAGYVNLFGQPCPLTPLENRFRHLAGQAGYEGGFIQHYFTPLVYPGVMPERWGLVSGLSVLIWNFLVYTLLVVTLRRSTLLRAARITYRGDWRIHKGKPRATTGSAQEKAERVSWWKRVSGGRRIMQDRIEQYALELLQAVREHHPDIYAGAWVNPYTAALEAGLDPDSPSYEAAMEYLQAEDVLERAEETRELSGSPLYTITLRGMEMLRKV